ncbi:MAG: Ku protein [Thermoanaerobaculia bacterium]|nr:Ku protein [Thermoanaerobaculia bacterium]
MPARPISSANISFGLVSIPIKLYTTADHSADIRFNMLDGEHKVRLKQQYISTKDGRVVPRNEMVKGYEFAKGQFVTFTDEEIQALSQKASPNIEITEFVPLAEVDPIFFEKSYYLGPEAGGERAYKLLAQAMQETGRCAVAKYAARGKQYLVLLRPFADGLIMQQLFYDDEIRAFEEVPLGEDVEIKDGELDLAIQLVDQIAVEEFEPDKYEDEVRDRIRAAIQQKIEGEEVTAPLDEAPKAQIIDLMQALKASLGEDDLGDEKKPPRRAEKKVSPRKRAAGGE